MRTLLFIILQILSVTVGQLIISTILLMLTIAGGIWRVDKSRKKDLKSKADIEYVDKQDDLIREEIKKEVVSHDKVHSEISNQYKQIQSDLTIIKEHLINK